MSDTKKDQQRAVREDRFLGLDEQPIITNAADATQVKKARKTQRHLRAQELEDLRAVLGTLAGRRLVWRLLKRCGTFMSTIGTTDAMTNYNAGRQDLGHFLLAEITAAQPDMLPQLMQEAYKETR